MSLIKEKSPTVSGDIAIGTLMGMGIELYTTRDSYSWVSRGTAYRVICRVRSVLDFEGDSRSTLVFDKGSSAILCCIIRSNCSTKRSLISLACRICRSSIESFGIRDRSIELAAL